MSILADQTLGVFAPATTTDLNPFPDGARGPDAARGYGGYTYAPDETLQGIFRTTSANERTGPNTGPGADFRALTSGGGTQYGPASSARRLGPNAHTLLGEMADMINPAANGTKSVWNTTGGGAQMGQTFMSSRSLRSLNDQTHSPGAPNASGGWQSGFDVNNSYGISNWRPEGGAGNDAVDFVKGVTAVAFEAAVPSDPSKEERGRAEVKEVIGVDQVEQADAIHNEVFRPSVTVSTGLRNLPPNPVIG